MGGAIGVVIGAGAAINISLKTCDYILIDYTVVYNREIKGKHRD